MSKIPPIRRLSAEDFKEQADWIGKLLAPINDFMERTSSSLNQRLTVGDNMLGTVLTAQLDGQWPVRIAWTPKASPKTVLVGQWARSDGADKTLVLRTTATTSSGSRTLSSVGDYTGLRAGLKVTGTGVPDDTHIQSIQASSPNLSMTKEATASATVTVDFFLDRSVQVLWQYNQNGELQLDGVTGIVPDSLNKYIVTLECKAG